MTRQPSEDNDCWHSEIVNEEMTGESVSGAEEEDDDSTELDELEDGEPASSSSSADKSAGKLLDSEDMELSEDKEETLELNEDEEDEAGKLDEPAEEELSITPVPPPPKPG